jgi:hypothetical protein
MSPVLAVKRCSRVTAARAAYFLHDQDPKRKFCVNISRGAAGIIMGYLELFDFGEGQLRSASEETVGPDERSVGLKESIKSKRRCSSPLAVPRQHNRRRVNLIVPV